MIYILELIAFGATEVGCVLGQDNKVPISIFFLISSNKTTCIYNHSSNKARGAADTKKIYLQLACVTTSVTWSIVCLI